MLAFLVELVVSVTIAGLTCSLMGGQFYSLMAVMTAIATLLLIYSAQGFVRNRDSAPFLVWVSTTFGIALVLGTLWPSVSLIYLWREWQRSRANIEEKS